MALPACPAHSSIWSALLPLRTMLTAPFLGTQPIYVAIMQVVVLCSQTLFKCSIAGPLEKVRVHAGSMVQKARISKLRLFLLLLNQENLSCSSILLASNAHPGE